MYLKMLKLPLPPTGTALPQMPTPNTSRWNIGGVGSPKRGAGIGHVHFMLFVLISFVLGSQREPSFQWSMGLTQLDQPCAAQGFSPKNMSGYGEQIYAKPQREHALSRN